MDTAQPDIRHDLTYWFEFRGDVRSWLSPEQMRLRIRWFECSILEEGRSFSFDPESYKIKIELDADGNSQLDAVAQAIFEIEAAVQDANGSLNHVTRSIVAGGDADWALVLNTFRPIPPPR